MATWHRLSMNNSLPRQRKKVSGKFLPYQFISSYRLPSRFERRIMFTLPDLSFFVVAAPAVVLSGLGKGGMGGALGMLGVPLMSLVMSPVKAAAIMLPLLLAMDGFALLGWRNYVNWRVMKIILPAGLAGVVLGILIFNQLPENAIRFLIGFICIFFCLDQWFGHHFKDTSKKPKKMMGYFWGTVSGFTSFGLHAGGGPLSIYMLPLKLDKQALAGSTAMFFGIINFSKMPAYAQLGQFTSENLILSAILFPLCPISVRLGIKLVNKIPTEIFYRVIYISLFITGVKLLFDSL